MIDPILCSRDPQRGEVSREEYKKVLKYLREQWPAWLDDGRPFPS